MHGKVAKLYTILLFLSYSRRFGVYQMLAKTRGLELDRI